MTLSKLQSFNSSLNSQKEKSYSMFNQLAENYDLINRVLSLGIDHGWRKKLISLLPKSSQLEGLDLATGTGDLVVQMLSLPQIQSLIGVDLSKEMLRKAYKKTWGKKHAHKASYLLADALSIPFAENSFNFVTMAFGLRNVTSIEECFKEIKRVLKPGGKALILEFSIPQNKLLQKFYLFYLKKFVPVVGGYLSSNQSAYQYLNDTILEFPSGQNLCDIMSAAGLGEVSCIPLSGGIASIYVGYKL